MADDDETDLSEYTVEINGIEHTLMLTEEDAKARGVTKGGSKSATPDNKASAPANKGKG